MTKPKPKSEQTNEEYLRSLNTEQLAEYLADLVEQKAGVKADLAMKILGEVKS